MSLSHLQLLLSAVTGEFGSHRESLATALRRAGVEVKTQEDFPTTGLTTLEKLDRFIEDCDAVLHLVGQRTGAIPSPQAVDALRRRHRDLTARLATRLPALAVAMAAPNPQFSFTQWEAYLAIYHNKPLFIYYPAEMARRDKPRTDDPATDIENAERMDDAERERQRAVQRVHFQCICDMGWDRGAFEGAQDLCVKVLADRNQLSPPPDPEVSPTRLRHVAQHLVGREAALRRLDEAWASEETSVVVIRAFGGVGKTSLVAAWMSEMAAQGWRRARRVFDWTFYSQGTRQAGQDAEQAAPADLFIAAALRFCRDPEPQLGSPWERGARLARLVAATRTVLVLDGLEPLQHPPGALAGKIKDDAVCALLKGLAQQNRGLCIVTTRERLPDLQNFYGRTAIDWELDYLSEEAGAKLLHSLGVRRAGRAAIEHDDEELRQASREVRGHALTLQLMGNYLHLVHGGDVRQRDVFDLAEGDPQFKTNPADAEKPYGHAFKVMGAYETWLNAGGVDCQRQLAILRLLGFFDRPADPRCLAALCAEPAIPGLTDALVGITDAEWRIAVKRLEDIGLVTSVEYRAPKVRGYSREGAERAWEEGMHTLGDPPEFTPPGTPHSDALEAHPLLREYFAHQLKAATKVAGTLRLPSDSDSIITRDGNVTPDVRGSSDRTRSVHATLDAWREGHRRLFDHLQARVPYWPEGLDGLQPLYQAVVHGCHAKLHEQALGDVYFDRILRGRSWGKGRFYSSRQLGAISSNLSALACFLEIPWTMPSSNISREHQWCVLADAGICLYRLGRLIEGVEATRAGLELAIEQQNWEFAAHSASHLSEGYLTLGEVCAAVASALQSVIFADRTGDTFLQMVNRAEHANALHQAGHGSESLAMFRDAETRQANERYGAPVLYFSRGVHYCDFLLGNVEREAWRLFMASSTRQRASLTGDGASCVQHSEVHGRELAQRCTQVAERAMQTVKIAEGCKFLVNIAMDHLTLGRAALYGALLHDGEDSGPKSEKSIPDSEMQSLHEHITAAVDGLRRSGQMDYLPRGLLTRAWFQHVVGDTDAAADDLDEAWEIAERGSMRLHMADIQLYRARLFRDRSALAEAARLIDECGYHRRDDELVDAQAAANTWS